MKYAVNLNTVPNAGEPGFLFFHGFGFHSGIWHSLQTALSPFANSLAVDLPGFGHTEAMAWDVFYQQVADLIDKPVWLCGWSLGGKVAIEFAARYPEKVKGLIMIASNPCFTETDSWPGMGKQRLEEFSFALTHEFEETIKRFLALQWPTTVSSRRAIKEMLKVVYDAPRPSKWALENALAFLLEKDLRDNLKSLDCSQSLILGRLDVLVPSSVATSIVNVAPQIQTHILPQAAHAPFLSHPIEVIEILKSCFNKSL